MGHTNFISCIKTWKNHLISGSFDQTIKIWDLTTKQCKKTLSGHEGTITSLILYNNRYAISGSLDQTIRTWDLEKGKCVHVFSYKKVMCLTLWNHHFLISGSQDGSIEMWRLRTRRHIVTLGKHAAPLIFLAIWKNQYLISASDDNIIKIWDLAVQECVRIITQTNLNYLFIKGDHLFIARTNTPISILNFKILKLRYLYIFKNKDYSAIPRIRCLTTHGSHLITALSNHTMKEWDLLKKGKQIQKFKEKVLITEMIASGDLLFGIQLIPDSRIRIWKKENIK